MSNNERHQIGNAIILVSDDTFVNSYQVGYLQYHLDYKDRALTEQELYDYIMRTCLDVQRSDRANTGRIVGWLGAMHERHEACQPSAEQEQS